jgi:hypothetical protein
MAQDNRTPSTESTSENHAFTTDIPHTVVGYSRDTLKPLVTQVQAIDWLAASQDYVYQARDAQLVACMAGLHIPVLLQDPLAARATPMDMSAAASPASEQKLFTCIGFDRHLQLSRFLAVRSEHASEAALAASLHHGSNWMFCAVFAGPVRLLGSWAAWRELSVIETVESWRPSRRR